MWAGWPGRKTWRKLLECRAALGGDLTLLLVGDGPERAALESRAEALGIRDEGGVCRHGGPPARWPTITGWGMCL